MSLYASVPLIGDERCPGLNMAGIAEDTQPYIENVVRQMDKDGTLPPFVKRGNSRAGEGIYSGGGLPQASR
jgi:hypothetical protein